MIPPLALVAYVPILVAVFAAWGALWYRLGKLAGEVREHNKLIADIKDKLDDITNEGGCNNESE